jgi:hypothetical protein
MLEIRCPRCLLELPPPRGGTLPIVVVKNLNREVIGQPCRHLVPPLIAESLVHAGMATLDGWTAEDQAAIEASWKGNSERVTPRLK